MTIAEEKVSAADEFKTKLEFYIRSGFSCLWVQTQEESRALRVIKETCKKLSCSVYFWDCLGELYTEDANKQKIVKEQKVPPQEVFPKFAQKIYKDRDVLCVMDYNFYVEQPNVIRNIRNQIPVLHHAGKVVIFVGPRLPIPPDLEKDITFMDMPLPTREDLDKIFSLVVNSAKDASPKPIDFTNGLREGIINSSIGMTSQEAEDSYSLAVVRSTKQANVNPVQLVLDQKCHLLKRQGVLEYLSVNENMESVGGLLMLKDWLIKRKDAFSERARRFGVPSPKGLLLVGVPGCGKSLVAKAVASYWEVPLLRLDMGRIFQSLVGKSEETVRTAIRLAETHAPCILWIDEAEKGLAGAKTSGQLDSGVTARVVGTILTWMQEKTSSVFVAATANDVSKIPPELLRKGRFDEIFFVDLPNEEERAEIIRIQLKKRARVIKDIQPIIEASLNFTGAEIEQAVVSALYDCFFEKERDLTAEDICKTLNRMIPLSRTMEEDINFLRTWGQANARNASGAMTTIPMSSGLMRRKVRTD